jgi:hypothetical protein
MSASDDVVDLENLGLARVLQRNVCEKRHDTLPEGPEPFLRIPDFAHQQVTARVEHDVIVESVCGHLVGLL